VEAHWGLGGALVTNYIFRTPDIRKKFNKAGLKWKEKTGLLKITWF